MKCVVWKTGRQLSLLQVGSLVPAESAELHVVDAVHTRMGASDNLAMGSSTFLEVAHSLNTSLTSHCHAPICPTLVPADITKRIQALQLGNVAIAWVFQAR